MTVSVDYHRWPQLTELLPTSFPGVKTSRDEFLVSIDREALEKRVAAYFDPHVSHDEMRSRFPTVMAATARFDPIKTRDELRKRGVLSDNILHYAYRPLDRRWIYWESETKLLDEKRSDYQPHVGDGNQALVSQQRPRGAWDPCQVISCLGCLDLLDRSATVFPRSLVENGLYRPNLPQSVREYVEERGLSPDAIFHHVVAILHAPSYHSENIGALQVNWPRVPIHSDAKQLGASDGLGTQLANLLDSATSIEGVTRGKLRPGIRTLGLPHKKNGKPLDDSDLSLSAGWGHVQISRTGSTLVMPGVGLSNERDYTPAERAALDQDGKALGMSSDAVLALLGNRTLDVHLNADAMWTNVPANVWAYTLGGYQVIKKWLSYREKEILGRPLRAEEVAYASEMIRRIAAILLLSPALDANYEAAKANAVEWKDGRPSM